jgi:hypothetical protein
MSFDLTGKIGSFHWKGAGWAAVLSCAEEYGWKPAGTQPPRRVKAAEWEGSYDTNDGQLVSTEDASNLASALQSALDDEFRRVEAKRQPAPKVTEVERQQAMLKLATAMGTMSEIEDAPAKGKAKKEKRPKAAAKPRTAEAALERQLSAQGMNMTDFSSLVATMYGQSVDATEQEPWYLTDEGRTRSREFIEFCRAGEFRIE